jgi:hypothetical protein
MGAVSVAQTVLAAWPRKGAEHLHVYYRVYSVLHTHKGVNQELMSHSMKSPPAWTI